MTGHHRKHGIRLLGQSGNDWEQQPAAKKGRRIYDEAVRQALIVVWEAADRICGKRLKAALPHLVESMERHGHLHPGPAAPAHQDTGEPPAPTQEAAVARPQYSGTNLRRLECGRHQDSRRLTWWSTTAAPGGVP